MMTFTTEVPIVPSSHTIRVADSIVLVGSCFAQEMGEWFKQKRFSIVVNPNGILFHPSVLARILRRAVDEKKYSGEEWVLQDGLFHSFDHHGVLSDRSADRLTQHTNQQLQSMAEALRSASTLVVTWGSAWGYQWNEDGQWVANCHKIPQQRFTKKLIEAHDIVVEWTTLLQELKRLNPTLNVVFSVSPVRYWRDGAHGNQLSKANLILAASRLANAFSWVHYFPAYEILLDELRDYRFYASDMLHPSPLAVEHIIGKFQTMFFDEKTKGYVQKVEPLLKFLQHRPLHIDEHEWAAKCMQREEMILELLTASK
jgi:hypothetical protein